MPSIHRDSKYKPKSKHIIHLLNLDMKTMKYITQPTIVQKMPNREVNMTELSNEFKGRGEVREFHFKQLMKSEKAFMCKHPGKGIFC
jgi:hypothetical protein